MLVTIGGTSMRSLRPQRILTAIAITAAATVLVAGDVAAAPNAVKAHVNGTGTMVGHCVGADSNVRLTAEATMAGAHLGAGTAAWTTCVDFGSHYVSDPPQTFTFTGNRGTLAGSVTDIAFSHINGDCTPTNLVGVWTVTVTVTGLTGTDKLADASGGQLSLTYRWARQDGGVCAQVPGFASLDMELDGAVTGTLS